MMAETVETVEIRLPVDVAEWLEETADCQMRDNVTLMADEARLLREGEVLREQAGVVGLVRQAVQWATVSAAVRDALGIPADDTVA